MNKLKNLLKEDKKIIKHYLRHYSSYHKPKSISDADIIFFETRDFISKIGGFHGRGKKPQGFDSKSPY